MFSYCVLCVFGFSVTHKKGAWFRLCSPRDTRHLLRREHPGSPEVQVCPFDSLSLHSGFSSNVTSSGRPALPLLPTAHTPHSSPSSRALLYFSSALVTPWHSVRVCLFLLHCHPPNGHLRPTLWGSTTSPALFHATLPGSGTVPAHPRQQVLQEARRG